MLGLHDDMIANPADYGLTNVTDRLRTSTTTAPDEYMWWDNLHFTRAVHAVLGNAAADLIEE